MAKFIESLTGKNVRFGYIKADATAPQTYTVQDVKGWIDKVHNVAYLCGFCVERGEKRTFRHDRIVSCEVLN
jgi:predicted DNA-binding transcriptional regulator YafY